MKSQISRSDFLAGGAALLCGGLSARAATLNQFRLGIITDEVTQDFEHALLWAKSFGLEWVELRFVWNKYVTEFTPDDIKRAKDLLAKHSMKVSVIDSAFFKTLLPGTESKYAEAKNDPLQSGFSMQSKILESAFARAKDFSTDKVRIFSFLRVADPKTVFDRVARELESTAALARRENVRLLLENEFSCNVATGVESAAMLKAVPAPALGLNWDSGNAFAAGETKPFPDGYAPLDKKRLWHCHLKDAAPGPRGEEAKWLPIGAGQIDFVGQFRALLKDGYEGTLSLETHYLNAAKDKEASSRESLEGLLAAIQKA